jgi:hypothetical protein
VVRFTNNVRVRIDFWYKEVNPQKPGTERTPLCQARFPLVVPFPTYSCKTPSIWFDDVPPQCR